MNNNGMFENPKSTAECLTTSSQTHQPLQESLRCISCKETTHKVSFYPCCFEPNCSACYNGFHLFECKKKIDNQSFAKTENTESSVTCQRCEGSLLGQFVICRQCHNASLCQQCFKMTHSTGKFLNHTTIESDPVLGVQLKQTPHNWSKNQILKCPEHKQLRNIVSERGELVCSGCISEYKVRKIRVIDFRGTGTETLIDQVKQRIQSFSQEFWMKEEEHMNKWADLKIKLEQDYRKILQKLEEKYNQNKSTLQKIEELDLKIVKSANKLAKRIEEELEWGLNHFSGKDSNPFIARLYLVAEQLFKQKKLIQTTQIFGHKIGQIEWEKLENLLKNFNIQKIKQKEDEKENASTASLRKSNNSVNRLSNSNNLANSRRSLSKSVSKNEDLRASTKTLNKKSQLESSTCSINKKVPNFSNQNSSGKKPATGLSRNSMLGGKIEDINIQPMALSFDSKEFASSSNTRSKIHFASAKTQENNSNQSFDLKKVESVPEPNLGKSVNLQNSSANNSMADMFTRVGKRKSDYFDLRERMRKPNVVNNRFARK